MPITFSNAGLPLRFEACGARMTIGPLDRRHLDAVNQIEQRAHAYPWRREHLASSLGSHECLGLFVENAAGAAELIGYGVMSSAADESELLLLVLDTPWQGRGLGGILLNTLLDRVRGHARVVFLEVRRSNLAAQAMYEKVGFNQVGVRPNYYSGRGRSEDALVYATELFD